MLQWRQAKKNTAKVRTRYRMLVWPSSISKYLSDDGVWKFVWNCLFKESLKGKYSPSHGYPNFEESFIFWGVRSGLAFHATPVKVWLFSWEFFFKSHQPVSSGLHRCFWKCYMRSLNEMDRPSGQKLLCRKKDSSSSWAHFCTKIDPRLIQERMRGQ